MSFTAQTPPGNIIVVDPSSFSLCNNVMEHVPIAECNELEDESDLPRWSILKDPDEAKSCVFPNKPVETTFIEFINEELFDKMSLQAEIEAKKYDVAERQTSVDHASDADLEEVTLEYEMEIGITRSIASETDPILKCSAHIQTNNSLLDQKNNCGFVSISTGTEKQYFLQCFFCTLEYPLYRWIEFCAHIKLKHNNLNELPKKRKIPRNVCYNSNMEVVENIDESNTIITKRIQLPMDEKVKSFIMDGFKVKSASVGNKYNSHNLNLTSKKSSIANEIDESIVTQHQPMHLPPITDSDTILKSALSPKTSTPCIKFPKLAPGKLPTLANSFPNGTSFPTARRRYNHKEYNSVCNSPCGTISASEVEDINYFMKIENYDPNVDHCYSRKELTEASTVQKEPCITEIPEGENSIRFGKTKSEIVLDFLNELTYYPYLWYTRLGTYEMYESGLQDLVDKMNKRWNLLLTKKVLQQDILFIKKWYNENAENVSKDPDFKSEHEIFYEKCSEIIECINSNSTTKVTCDICEEWCFGDICLQVHKFRKHDIGELPYKCEICEKRFDYANSLNNHVKHHIKPSQLNAQKKTTDDTRFTCTICGKEYFFERSFNVHKDKCKSGERRFQCDVCGRRFLTRGVCRSHMTRHFPPLYECEVCAKKYHFSFQFNEHMKVHSRRFDYVCEWCGKMFIRQRSFKEHIQFVHRNEGLCGICNVTYQSASSLDKHRRTFHLPLIGLLEKLNERRRKGQKGGPPVFRKGKYQFIIDPATKKRRICCPDCDKHYFGYDSLYAHITRIHGYAPPKRIRKSKFDLQCKSESENNTNKTVDANSGTHTITAGANNLGVDLITTCTDDVKQLPTGHIDNIDNVAICELPTETTTKDINKLLADEVVSAVNDLVKLNENDGMLKDEAETVCVVPTSQQGTATNTDFELLFNAATNIAVD